MKEGREAKLERPQAILRAFMKAVLVLVPYLEWSLFELRVYVQTPSYSTLCRTRPSRWEPMEMAVTKPVAGLCEVRHFTA